MPEIHPGWPSANDDWFLRYRREDGAEVMADRWSSNHTTLEHPRPWIARFGLNNPLRGLPARGRDYGNVRRFGSALTAILALEEVERKRERTNG